MMESLTHRFPRDWSSLLLRESELFLALDFRTFLLLSRDGLLLLSLSLPRFEEEPRLLFVVLRKSSASSNWGLRLSIRLSILNASSRRKRRSPPAVPTSIRLWLMSCSSTAWYLEPAHSGSYWSRVNRTDIGCVSPSGSCRNLDTAKADVLTVKRAIADDRINCKKVKGKIQGNHPHMPCWARFTVLKRGQARWCQYSSIRRATSLFSHCITASEVNHHLTLLISLHDLSSCLGPKYCLSWYVSRNLCLRYSAWETDEFNNSVFRAGSFFSLYINNHHKNNDKMPQKIFRKTPELKKSPPRDRLLAHNIPTKITWSWSQTTDAKLYIPLVACLQTPYLPNKVRYIRPLMQQKSQTLDIPSDSEVSISFAEDRNLVFFFMFWSRRKQYYIYYIYTMSWCSQNWPNFEAGLRPNYGRGDHGSKMVIPSICTHHCCPRIHLFFFYLLRFCSPCTCWPDTESRSIFHYAYFRWKIRMKTLVCFGRIENILGVDCNFQAQKRDRKEAISILSWLWGLFARQQLSHSRRPGYIRPRGYARYGLVDVWNASPQLCMSPRTTVSSTMSYVRLFCRVQHGNQ